MAPVMSVQPEGQRLADAERVPHAGLLFVYTLAAVLGLMLQGGEPALPSSPGARLERGHAAPGATRALPAKPSSSRVVAPWVALPVSGAPSLPPPAASGLARVETLPRIAPALAPLPRSRAPPVSPAVG
jgi:hypothetical protein